MKNLIENVCYLSSLEYVADLYGLLTIDVERVYDYSNELKAVRLIYSIYDRERCHYLNFTREMLENLSRGEVKDIVENMKEKVILSYKKGEL